MVMQIASGISDIAILYRLIPCVIGQFEQQDNSWTQEGVNEKCEGDRIDGTGQCIYCTW